MPLDKSMVLEPYDGKQLDVFLLDACSYCSTALAKLVYTFSGTGAAVAFSESAKEITRMIVDRWPFS